MAAKNKVTATLNISFSDSSASGGALSLEVDDRPDGLNGGNTSFKPGDEVGFLRFKADFIKIDTQEATVGAIQPSGTGTKLISGDDADYITFSGSNTASLKYPADGNVTLTQQGKVFDKDGDIVSVNLSVKDQVDVTSPKEIYGVFKAEYSSKFEAFKLTSVPPDMLQALVFCIGTVDK